MSFVPQTKGLLNKPGQNNCFLNSAVQVLWHLDVFRRSFRELTGHACLGHESCIFCALKELFTQFQYSRETVLPPDSLRRALAETFSDQRRFQLGFMDDAAECFENMLIRLHCHLAPQENEDHCKAAHCISHEKFAMNLVEQIICTVCGATSEALPFTQMVHYVSTPALCHQAKSFAMTSTTISFGELLRSAAALGDIRDCPKQCGARVHIKRTLYNKPDIVSIGLVWDSERPNINHISDVFRVIGTSLRIQDVFDDQMSSSKQGMCKPASQKNASILQLAGLVTYYGKHFSTFFYHTKLESWIYFDDAAVREIGPHWEQVVEKCIRGHFQPLLLLYTNPNGTAVDTSKAPKTITMMPKPTSHHANHPSSLAMKRNGSLIPKNLQLKPLQYQSMHQTRQMVRPNHLRPYRPRPGSVDDLLNNCNSASEDVPDSPLTKSSSSSAYFSDIGEVDNNGYLSRQAVENIFNFQHMHQMKQRKQRSSTSSVESFDVNSRKGIDIPPVPNKVCSLQRCDSGNSSNSSANSDRHSSSSGSVLTSDNPYFGLSVRNLSSLAQYRYAAGNQTSAPRQLLSSDHGYDSFSISSSDSFPSGGPPTPVKQSRSAQQRLSQIPEDVQYMELINNSNLQDCDKLCSEADLLLLKSHEKEREGDIHMAALLSDSAAQKARSAMDAPYSNPQTMISAKIKHSMCVMRSASLHRRVKDLEAEEKRRFKAEQLEIQHSRQNSRDSGSGKHSRQNSKDGTLKESAKKEAEAPQSAKTLELYATLPKKNAKKKLLDSSPPMLSSSSSLRIKEDRRSSIPSILDHLRNSRKAEKLKETKSDVESVCSVPLPVKRGLRMTPSKESDSNYSDYYSEFEVNKSPKIALQRNNSGTGSCRESEVYADYEQLNKKQNRVRRKLLIGGFMKRKNRSLPDLREGSNPEANDINSVEIKTVDDCGAKSVAQVSRKGFHKITGLGNQGVGSQRSSLIKVNTPHVDSVMPKIVSNLPKISEQTQQNKSTTAIKNNNGNGGRTPNACPQSEQLHRRFNTPPPPEVITCLKSPNVNIGIEPSEELPPPPEDFLLDLRETRIGNVESIICDQTTSDRTLTDTLVKRSSQTKTINGVCPVDDLTVQSTLPPPTQANVEVSCGGTPTCKSVVVDGQKVNNGVKSVKDLALRFERLATTTSHVNSTTTTTSVTDSESQSISCPPPVNISHSHLPPSSISQMIDQSSVPQIVPQSPLPPPSSVPQMIPQSPVNYYNNRNSSLSTLRSGTSPSTGLRVVALLGTNLRVGQQDVCNASQQSHQMPPASPITSSSPSSNSYLRPERPPDYNTAMKRLGLMKAEMTNILQQQNNRLSTSSLDSYGNGQQQLSFAEECTIRSKRKCGPKKSVSFSDEVVLVSADFEEEEHFPNPLLERILANSNILSMTDKSQQEVIS